MGRFAEAATKISTGETIVLEDAHCAVLLFEKTTTNCFQCFKRCLTLCLLCDEED